jgi:hypothetical protein
LAWWSPRVSPKLPWRFWHCFIVTAPHEKRPGLDLSSILVAE